MIVKLTNKDEHFYNYMGKFFGSRIVQKETNDRIYDDPDKVWYIYLKDNTSLGFISVNRNTIKNIYAVNPDYLVDLFTEIKKDISLTSSIVPNLYVDIYETCDFHVTPCYKNFVIISNPSEKVGEIS